MTNNESPAVTADARLAESRRRLEDRQRAAGFDFPDAAAVRAYRPVVGDLVDFTGSDRKMATGAVIDIEHASVVRQVKVEGVGWIGTATVRAHS